MLAEQPVKSGLRSYGGLPWTWLNLVEIKYFSNFALV